MNSGEILVSLDIGTSNIKVIIGEVLEDSLNIIGVGTAKSMGMKITEERLRLLSKQGWEKLINIVDLKDSFNNALGTRVEIVFPLT